MEKMGFDGSSSASAGLNSPFSVTGGGGSAALSTGAGSPITGTGTPSGAAAWLPWLAVAFVAVGLVLVLGKKSGRGAGNGKISLR